jgi:hypothetical protein
MFLAVTGSGAMWDAMRENYLFLLHDPVAKSHHTMALFIFWGMTGVLLKIMAGAHAANNLDAWPVAVLTPIGLGTIVAGMSFAEIHWLPGTKDMPAWSVLAIGAALPFLTVVVPLTKWMLRGNYFGMASAWITTLFGVYCALYAAAFFYEGVNVEFAKVGIHRGVIDYRLKPEGSWQALGKSRPPLSVGSELRTADGAMVVLQLGRRNHLALGQNTRVQFTGFAEKGGIELQQGRVMVTVSQFEQAQFLVKTANTRITANSALFAVAVDGSKTTALTVADGSGEMNAMLAVPSPVVVSNGQSSTCANGGYPTKPVPGSGVLLRGLEAFRATVANPFDRKNRDVVEAF